MNISRVLLILVALSASALLAAPHIIPSPTLSSSSSVASPSLSSVANPTPSKASAETSISWARLVKLPLSQFTLQGTWIEAQGITSMGPMVAIENDEQLAQLGFSPEAIALQGDVTMFGPTFVEGDTQNKLTIDAWFIETLIDSGTTADLSEPPSDCRIGLKWDATNNELSETREFCPDHQEGFLCCSLVKSTLPIAPEDRQVGITIPGETIGRAILLESYENRNPVPGTGGPGELRIKRSGQVEFGALEADSSGWILAGVSTQGTVYFWLMSEEED